ncbi:hypothetical protein [Alkalibacillus haloalkaliphilus]|nr:hypothetical protein [Alkalibacillus haloalkaliphilus]
MIDSNESISEWIHEKENEKLQFIKSLSLLINDSVDKSKKGENQYDESN